MNSDDSSESFISPVVFAVISTTLALEAGIRLKQNYPHYIRAFTTIEAAILLGGAGGALWLLKPDWRKLKQKYFTRSQTREDQIAEEKAYLVADGIDPVRAEQLARGLLPDQESILYTSSLWFKVVEWMGLPEDPLKQRHEGKSWLEEFMPPNYSVGGYSKTFDGAKLAFELHPSQCVASLKAFNDDLYIQDICSALTRFLTDSEDSPDLLKCWVALQNDILQILQLSVADLDNSTDNPPNSQLENVHNSLSLIEGSGVEESKGLTDTRRFINRYRTVTKPYEEKTMQNWRLARWRRLEQVLTSQYASNPLVLKISDHLRRSAGSEAPLSAVYHEFQFNLIGFYQEVTGDKDYLSDGAGTLERLRYVAAKKQQAWAPLYETIKDLRADIEKKKQIITCLGFRHILEMLPAKKEIRKLFLYPNPSGSTGYWKLTWQFAIERELMILLYELLQTMAAADPNIIITPCTTSVPPSDSLRSLILYDFEECNKNKKFRRELVDHANEIANDYQLIASAFNTSVLAIGATPAITTPQTMTLHPDAGPAASAEPHTRFTDLLNGLGVKYNKWNCYERGLGLFSELSSSIHKYNKQYEVDEANWARSDYLVLQWLKPTTDDKGEVDWKTARVERNIPFKP